MKRRRDTLYLKYLRSRLGEREASNSAVADRRGAPRPGPAQPGSAGPQIPRVAPRPSLGGRGEAVPSVAINALPLFPPPKLFSVTAVSPCSSPCSTSVCMRH